MRSPSLEKRGRRGAEEKKGDRRKFGTSMEQQGPVQYPRRGRANAGRNKNSLQAALIPPSWVTFGTGFVGFCGLLPPRPHRLMALFLVAAGAYCFLGHHQQYPAMPPPPPPHLALSNRSNNRSRALSALRENNNATVTRHKLGTAVEEVIVDAENVYEGKHSTVKSQKKEMKKRVKLEEVLEKEESEEVRDEEEEKNEKERWKVEMEEELARRRERVWEVCKANGLVGEDGKSKTKPNAWEFFIDHRHRLIWCNIFKAASSSWMYNFNLLAGYKESYLRKSRKSPLSLARARFPRPTVEQLRDALPGSLSFLIVRDPFERLLSAYRNKIEGFRHKFYRKMAREMLLKFRTKTVPQIGSNKGSVIQKSPTFSEFVSWVVQSALKATRFKEGGYNGIPGFDEHWAPYFRFCTPCAVNFTVIAKMETLAEDESYVIEKTGIASALGRTKQGKSVIKRPREVVNAAVGGRTEDLIPRYFRTLTKEQLDSLYDIYRIDFLMFGYDATRYYEMLRL